MSYSKQTIKTRCRYEKRIHCTDIQSIPQYHHFLYLNTRACHIGSPKKRTNRTTSISVKDSRRSGSRAVPIVFWITGNLSPSDPRWADHDAPSSTTPDASMSRKSENQAHLWRHPPRTMQFHLRGAARGVEPAAHSSPQLRNLQMRTHRQARTFASTGLGEVFASARPTARWPSASAVAPSLLADSTAPDPIPAPPMCSTGLRVDGTVVLDAEP